MRRWISAVLVAVCLSAPAHAFAQSGRAPSPVGLGISKDEALVIGAGIVGGAVVLHFVIAGDFTFFAGGIVGGLAALWWYENGGEARLRPLLKPNRAAGAPQPRYRPIAEGVTPTR